MSQQTIQKTIVTTALGVLPFFLSAQLSASPSTGITALPGAEFTVLSTTHGLVNNQVSCIVADTAGRVYLTTGYENQGTDPAGTGAGISRWDGQQFANYTTAQGLPHNTVQACALDEARNLLWFGTLNGLSRFNPATSTFTTFLAGQKIQDVVVHGNNVWVATFTNGVYRLDAATGNQLNQYPLGNNEATSIVVDNGGTIWAGTHGTGLYTLGTSFTLVTTPATSTSIVQDLEVDASNNLWISVWNTGVYRRTPAGTATLFTAANGLGPTFNQGYRTYRIERDLSNNLWFSHGSAGHIGTPQAAVTFLSAAQVNAGAPAFERYTEANGFPTNLVLSLFSQNTSTMWFGSFGAGAWKLAQPTGTPGCTFTLSPTSNNAVPNTGTKTIFNVVASAPSCAWTASSNRSWAQVFPLNGTGNGPIEYTIFPNFSTSVRTASFNVGGATFGVTQSAGVGTPNQRFVGQIYFNILGRLASQSEIDFQASQLAGGTPRADLVWSFFNSSEFNIGGRFVAGIYVGLLDRNAEYGGWLFQRNALATGAIAAPADRTLVKNFLASQEYMLKFGNPSNDEFARLLYRHILLREASPAEVQFRSGQLASGITRFELASQFLSSDEFRSGTGPRLTAFLLYALLLQRDPTADERALREGQIAGGADVKALIAEILNSTEFNNLLL
jgi:hypothetical protein